MAYLKYGQPGFWDSWPEELAYFHELALKAPGTQIGYHLMGDVSDNPPTIAVLNMQPGEVQPRHSHRCHRFEIVVKGTLITESGLVLESGDVMTSVPDEPYGPSQAGPEGCVTFEIFSDFSNSYKGALIFDDGEEVDFDMTVPGETSEEILAERAAVKRTT